MDDHLHRLDGAVGNVDGITGRVAQVSFPVNNKKKPLMAYYIRLACLRPCADMSQAKAADDNEHILCPAPIEKPQPISIRFGKKDNKTVTRMLQAVTRIFRGKPRR